MAVDVAGDSLVVESDDFQQVLTGLQEIFPDELFEASDELRRLVDAWGAFGQAIEPLKDAAREFVGDRDDSLPERIRRELSLINEYTASGVWSGNDAPSVTAVQEAKFVALVALTDAGVDSAEAWAVVEAVRILANGGVLLDETEELS